MTTWKCPLCDFVTKQDGAREEELIRHVYREHAYRSTLADKCPCGVAFCGLREFNMHVLGTHRVRYYKRHAKILIAHLTDALMGVTQGG